MISNPTAETLTKLHEIFFPYAAERIRDVREKNHRFVHYTSASVATEILRNKEFWMRSPACMNDFMEVEHGINCLRKVYNGDSIGKSLRQTMDDIHPGVVGEITHHFASSPFNPRKNHFISCVSEHRKEEDEHGRLSMWRAYGSGAGVAIVLNAESLLSKPGPLFLQTSPVAYFNDSHVEQELLRVTDNLKANAQFLKCLSKTYFTTAAINMLRFAALATKHEGFKEELEWRLIYSPEIQRSALMKKEVRSINGIPQTIYKIPLTSTPAGEATGAEIPSLIDRIIIGPTQYPLTIYNAFVELLADAGVAKPEEKVFASGIPLRT